MDEYDFCDIFSLLQQLYTVYSRSWDFFICLRIWTPELGLSTQSLWPSTAVVRRRRRYRLQKHDDQK